MTSISKHSRLVAGLTLDIAVTEDPLLQSDDILASSDRGATWATFGDWRLVFCGFCSSFYGTLQ